MANRCRYTGVYRCEEEATVTLLMQYSAIPGVHPTEVCERHALALEARCAVSRIKVERET